MKKIAGGAGTEDPLTPRRNHVLMSVILEIEAHLICFGLFVAHGVVHLEQIGQIVKLPGPARV